MHASEFETRLAEKDAEIARLRAEIGALRTEVTRLGTETAKVREELVRANGNTVELAGRIVALTDAVAKSNDRIAELLAAVERKKAAKAKPAAPPPAEPPPVLDGDAQSAFDGRPAAPELPGPLCDRPRPKQIPTGRKPLPPGLERDESTVQPERCVCGCADFDWIDEVLEEKLHVQAHQRVRTTHRKTGRCRSCNRRTTAEAPPSPFERSKVTCEWLAWFIAQKFELHVALDRLKRSLTAQGLPLAISFLVAMTEAAADILAPIDGANWKGLLDGGWMGTDGTGLKVQVRGVGLHHGYLEVYHRDDLVVYHYEAEKGGETQAEKLAKYEGALLIDAESRYNETFRKNPSIIEYNCNAHPRRKLRDAETVQPILAAEAGRFVSAMFDAEAEGRALGLTGDARKDWRQSRIRPLTERFRLWIDAVKPTLLPGDALGKVLVGSPGTELEFAL